MAWWGEHVFPWFRGGSWVDAALYVELGWSTQTDLSPKHLSRRITQTTQNCTYQPHSQYTATFSEITLQIYKSLYKHKNHDLITISNYLKVTIITHAIWGNLENVCKTITWYVISQNSVMLTMVISIKDCFYFRIIHKYVSKIIVYIEIKLESIW